MKDLKKFEKEITVQLYRILITFFEVWRASFKRNHFFISIISTENIYLGSYFKILILIFKFNFIIKSLLTAFIKILT